MFVHTIIIYCSERLIFNDFRTLNLIQIFANWLIMLVMAYNWLNWRKTRGNGKIFGRIGMIASGCNFGRGRQDYQLNVNSIRFASFIEAFTPCPHGEKPWISIDTCINYESKHNAGKNHDGKNHESKAHAGMHARCRDHGGRSHRARESMRLWA